MRSNSLQAAILDALEQVGGRATTTRLARWLGKQPPNISTELNELVQKGLVVRGERDGREIPYSLVEEPTAGREGI